MSATHGPPAQQLWDQSLGPRNDRPAPETPNSGFPWTMANIRSINRLDSLETPIPKLQARAHLVLRDFETRGVDKVGCSGNGPDTCVPIPWQGQMFVQRNDQTRRATPSCTFDCVQHIRVLPVSGASTHKETQTS